MTICAPGARAPAICRSRLTSRSNLVGAARSALTSTRHTHVTDPRPGQAQAGEIRVQILLPVPAAEPRDKAEP